MQTSFESCPKGEQKNTLQEYPPLGGPGIKGTDIYVLPRGIVLLFTMACGLSVANVYYAQPLLDAMAHEFSIGTASIGIVVTLTQVGYALGLFFIVPLGDLLDRRLLIVTQAFASATALTVVAFSPNAAVFLAGMIAVGLLAVVVQVLVAFVATLAAENERGSVVGIVTSGVVIGILSARFVAGVLADFGGWRLVYLTSAVLTLIMSGLLYRVLPRHKNCSSAVSYPKLLRSVLLLFFEEPLLRVRAVLAMLIFAAFSVLWTSMVLPLSAPPFLLSHTQIGLFGLAGVAGALGARRAGYFVDRGFGQLTTGMSLAILMISWIFVAFTSVSLWALVVGVVLLDLAVQAVHVTNQSMLFAKRPEASSRLVGGYMVFYSIGSGIGSIASTMTYASFGWLGVCALGAAISGLALMFWAMTRRMT